MEEVTIKVAVTTKEEVTTEVAVTIMEAEATTVKMGIRGTTTAITTEGIAIRDTSKPNSMVTQILELGPQELL